MRCTSAFANFHILSLTFFCYLAELWQFSEKVFISGKTTLNKLPSRDSEQESFRPSETENASRTLITGCRNAFLRKPQSQNTNQHSETTVKPTSECVIQYKMIENKYFPSGEHCPLSSANVFHFVIIILPSVDRNLRGHLAHFKCLRI
jgi:hypothetical protein